MITVPVFTRLMSRDEYGQYSVFVSWQAVVEIFISLKLYSGVYNKGLSRYRDKMDEYALSMQYVATFSTAVLMAVYMIFRKPINAFTGMSTILTFGLLLELLMTTPVAFWSVKERYKYKYREFVIATVVFAVVNPLIGIISVLLSDNKGIARIYALIMVQILYGIFFYVVNIIKGKGKFNVQFARYALSFNIPLLPHYISEYILNSSDRIMIQKLQGYSFAGLYSVAYGLGMLLTIITSSINQALVPWIYQSLDRKNFDAIRRVTSALGFLMIVLLAGFIILAPEFICMFAGQSYADAMYVISPVCVSIFLLFWYTICANIEFYYEKNTFTMFISIVGAACNIGLNFVFIPKYGFVAAGYTTLFSYMVYGIGHMIFSQYVFRKIEKETLFGSRVYVLQMSLILISGIGVSFLYGYRFIRYGILLMMALGAVLVRRRIVSLIKSVTDNYY